MSYQDAFKTALQYIGAIAVLYLGYKLFSFNSLWLLPTRSLAHYNRQGGAWALITGASAGIGRGCAEELAVRGFNVILLGHLPDELELVKKQINQNSPKIQVEIVILNVMQATNPKIEQAIDTVTSLPITILVNNVGGVPAGLRDLIDYTAVEMDRTINLNARFMAQCSRIMLPVLVKNGPSLMMNVSSIGRLGMPAVVPYSGTKAFNAALSRGMARECKAYGQTVDVVAVLPVEVSTEMNKLSPGAPNSRQFARAMMDYVPTAASRGWLEICPYWLHAVQMVIMENIPEWLFLTLVMRSFNQKKEILKAQTQKAR